MSRRGMRWLGVPAVFLLLAAFLAVAADAPAASPAKKAKKTAKAKILPADFDTHLPVLGTKLAEFPAGPGKPLADRGCVFCHSADIVVQQRLTEKQWTAEVTKMAGWGADVPAENRDELVAYLVKNFGTDGPKYEAVVTRPVGK